MSKLPTQLAQLRDAAIENESQLCQCAGPCCYGCEEKVKSLVTVGFDACAASLLPLLQECREVSMRVNGEMLGILKAHETVIRQDAGNSNFEALNHALRSSLETLAKLDAALGGPSEQDRVRFDGEWEEECEQ